MTETDIALIIWLVAMAIVAGTLLGVVVVEIFRKVSALVVWIKKRWRS